MIGMAGAAIVAGGASIANALPLTKGEASRHANDEAQSHVLGSGAIINIADYGAVGDGWPMIRALSRTR